MRVAATLLALGLALAPLQAASDKKESSEDLSHGFGTDIEWVAWPDAVSTALDLDKPIFLLIHKTWCGACKALKSSLTTSSKRKEFVELSRKFVMVNTEDDDEPEDDEYAPDGRYIPRLFMLDKYGKALAVDNKKNYANNAHYFPQMVDVLRAMKQGLKLYAEQEAASPDEPVKVPKSKTASKDDASDKKQEVKATEKKTEAAEEQPTVVETPEEEHLGEIHLTDEQIALMESGGCPHAAAARAAALREAASEENGQTEEIREEAPKKTEKKKTEKTQDETKKETKKTGKDTKEKGEGKAKEARPPAKKPNDQKAKTKKSEL